jgi:dihydrofolate reductase
MINLFASFTKTLRIIRDANGQPLFKSPSIDALFRQRVNNQAVLMGRVTFDLLENPKGVPGCINIVISRDTELVNADPSVIVVPDLDAARAVPRGVRDLWLIGGGSIYDQALAQGLVELMVINEVWMPVTRDQAEGALTMPSLRPNSFTQTVDRFIHDDNGLTIHNQVFKSVL